jgi:transcriptional regulator with XRE-family HTH domain
MNLKNQLRLYMDRNELSATQLAKRSGVSKQVISLWLSGGSPRKLEQVKQVAAVLGTTIDNLCYGNAIEENKNGFTQIPDDDWISGVFEIKLRKIKL